MCAYVCVCVCVCVFVACVQMPMVSLRVMLYYCSCVMVFFFSKICSETDLIALSPCKLIISALFYQEARRLAIVAEAKGYMATKKLQTVYRGKVEWRKHQRRLEAAKLLQQWTRTRLVRLRFLVTVSVLVMA